MINSSYLTPSEIVTELDQYIIGQQDAKRNVAVALRNRWRRMNIKSDIKSEISPNNILMIGSTGVGKTEIARRLAGIAGAPFVKVEASKFTEVGYVGRDVESMVRDLVERAVNMVKVHRQEEVKEKANEAVIEIILDILIPPLMNPISSQKTGQDANTSADDVEINHKTRDAFREKIKKGELEDRKIDIQIKQRSGDTPGFGMMGAGMMDETSMINLQEMVGGMFPKKTKKKKVTVAEAKKILFEEEALKLIDMDDVKEEAITTAENSGIIFIDEIDKVVSGSEKKGGGIDVSREGVQRDLLPIVEGSAVTTKYGVIKTDHILFIAAGAFHVSKPADLIPEMQGRFPIRVELDNLTKDNFLQILKEPKNALIKQYIALFDAEGVTLKFENEALYAIAEIAYTINLDIENIGARRLHTVMSRLLNTFLFDVPDKIKSGSHITITSETVKEKLEKLVKNTDLSEYIL